MPQPGIDIHHVARLARLSLSEAEVAAYGAQLGRILGYIATLDDHDLGTAEPTAHAAPIFDVWREDEAGAGLSNPQALANAPRKSQGQFQMPRVIEE